MADETLFGWVHLSDIHVGHGDKSHGWDQELVLDRLAEDLDAARALGAPTPNALLATGDIAFSGAGRSPDEYDRAKARLVAFGAAVGLGPDRIFIVPGNHDVDRNTDRTPFIASFVDSLRKGETPIDTAFADDSSRALLAKRMAKYLDMSATLAPACFEAPKPADQRLFWRHTIEGSAGLRVRLVGLNTALLSRDDTDKEKLRIGKQQLEFALRPAAGEGEIIVLLSHHPFDWLGDGKDANQWIASGAHLHLFGHVHDADTVQVTHGTGSKLVRVTAGAAHGDAMPAWIPASHGYNFGGIVRDASGALSVRVWPRRWADKAKRFRVDTDALEDGKHFAEHPLGVSIAHAESAAPSARSKLPKTGPVRVYISHAPEDTGLVTELQKHLKLHQRRGFIESYSTRAVGAGAEWKGVVDAKLNEAHVILLVLSNDFVASDYCFDVEMESARERYEAGEVLIVPVLAREMDFGTDATGQLWFERLQRVPREMRVIERQGDSTRAGRDHVIMKAEGIPVSAWPNLDDAMTAVVKELRQMVERARSEET